MATNLAVRRADYSRTAVVSPYRAAQQSASVTVPAAPILDTVSAAAAPPAARRSLSKLASAAMGCALALGVAGSALMAPAVAAAAGPITVKVLTLNDQVDAEHGVPNIVDLIRTSGADIVGLQESSNNTVNIAQALHFNYLQQTDETAILSRFPITGTTPHKYGVTVQLSPEQDFTVFNGHPYYKPYQPYQLLSIPLGEGDDHYIKTEKEAIEEAIKARGTDVLGMLEDVNTIKPLNKPIVLMGDFNEPSFLDWTDATAKIGRNPMKVEWPSTHWVAQAGFKDSYRVMYPDVIANPGYTWTPTTSPDDPKDHHDRIDFVFYRGDGIQLKKVDIVGENLQNATIVVSPYPTDHRSVLATFELAPAAKR